MALSMNYTFRGLEVPNAYFKFYQFRGYQNKINFFVSVHASKDSPYIDILEKEYEMPITMGSKSIAEQAYEFLKAQPEFYDAVDVLEDGQVADEITMQQPAEPEKPIELDDGSEYLSRV